MLPNDKKTFEKLVKALRKAEKSPKELVGGILQLWLQASYPHLTRPSADAKLLQDSPIVEFASWASRLDLLTAAFWLGSAYASLSGNETRKKHSLYFTPPYLANRLLDNADEALLLGKIIDPACGGAAFLAPAAERVAKKLVNRGHSSAQILEYLEANLYGCDNDTFLCELSATFIRMVLAEHIAGAGREPTFKIQPGDGLTTFENQVSTFSLVLCNPPYKKLAKDEAAPHLISYADVIKGQPNLYTLFMRRSTRLLASKGKAVLLTPMSFLSGQYFSKLRQVLTQEGHVKQLDLIHEKEGVFLGAEQDSVITVWEKSGTAAPTVINALSAESGCSAVGNLSLAKVDKPWSVPRTLADNELLPFLQHPKHSLSSYGYKPRIGAIVVHRDKRKRYDQIDGNSAAKHPIPIIWASDVGTDGVLRLNADGSNEFNFVDMELASSTCITRQPAVAVQRVTSHEQKRRLVCAPVSSTVISAYGGVVAENHVCLIERETPSSSVTPELLSDILRTETLDRLFRCISGATNVSAYELMQLPLPDPKKVRTALTDGYTMEQAVRIGFGLPILEKQDPRIVKNKNLEEHTNVGEGCCT